MHFPDGLSSIFLDSSTAFFISATPAVTAFNCMNLYLVVLLITFAIDVFPQPVGPHRIKLVSLSAFIVLYSILSCPSISSCPTNSSSFVGRTLCASGSILFHSLCS